MEENTQTNLASENAFEVPRIRLATVVFRTLSGFVGGVLGAAIMFLLFVLADSTSQGLFSGQGDTFNPMLILALLGAGFLCMQTSAIISTSLFAYCQREKYSNLATTLVHVFAVNLIIFLLLTPLYVYVIAASKSETDLRNYTVYLIGLHAFLSTFSSSMIAEIIADYRYAILSVYSVSIATLTSILIAAFIASSTEAITALISFLPIAWTSAGLMIGIIEMIYWWMYDVYGVDYLNTATKFETYEEPQDDRPDILNEDEK